MMSPMELAVIINFFIELDRMRRWKSRTFNGRLGNWDRSSDEKSIGETNAE